MATEEKVVPVARIDLAFEEPDVMIREAIRGLLPKISGNEEEMLENINTILAQCLGQKVTVSCAETDEGISIVFFRDGPV
jgi:ribosomal protein L13